MIEKLENIFEEEQLENVEGYAVVLYFYPKDNTKGCTIEALEFSELYDEFLKYDTKVLGISKDTKGTHKNFRKNYDLKMDLIADPKREIHKIYDVLQPAKMYGKDVIKTRRSTFVYDQNHTLVKAFYDVKPEGHAKEVLDFVRDCYHG